MFPPSSLICNVTTASPIQTIEKTPEKTRDACSPFARIDKNILSSKQKMSGPLHTVSDMLAIPVSTNASKRSRKESQHSPEIPVAQTLAHPPL